MGGDCNGTKEDSSASKWFVLLLACGYAQQHSAVLSGHGWGAAVLLDVIVSA